MSPSKRKRQDHETGKTKLSGGQPDGVEPLQLGFGHDRGDRIAEGSERNHDGAAKKTAGDMVSSRIAGMADHHHQHPAEAEENAADGEQSGPGAMEGHGEKQSPDRRGGIDHGGDVAGHGALTPGKKGEGNGVIEQGDG